MEMFHQMDFTNLQRLRRKNEMKKIKFAISALAIAATCSVVGVHASTSGYRTVKVTSGDAVEIARNSKSSSTARAGAWLSAIGAPDTIGFWAYDYNSGSYLTYFTVTESSSVAAVTYGSGAYTSGQSGYAGRGVKGLTRSVTFSLGEFPINTNFDFY